MSFPNAPATGKNAKVSISFSDGAYELLSSMTIQPSYSYKGEILTDRIYLLGAGKTLLNMRSAVEPQIAINGIIDGLIVTPSASTNKVQASAGTITVDGTEYTVNANAEVAVTRPADANSCWNAVVVDTATRVISCVKGKDIAGATTNLINTYDDPSTGAAGARPLIAATQILVALLKLNEDEAAVVASSDILYSDRETADIDIEVLPNIGGVKIPQALVKLHTGAVGRAVKFTGYYQDAVLSEIGTAKAWTCSPASQDVSEALFSRTIAQTEQGAWSFTFSQLATDQKVKNALMSREGHAAVRLQYPNGGYFQGAATLTASFNVAPGSFNAIDITGTFLDMPVFV